MFAERQTLHIAQQCFMPDAIRRFTFLSPSIVFYEAAVVKMHKKIPPEFFRRDF